MRTSLIAALAMVFITLAPSAQAQRLIPFSAYLADQNEAPLNGVYSVTFRIYGVPSGGSHSWSETQATASIIDGRLNVILGEITPLATYPSGPGQPRYLGITVEAGPEMAPRHRLIPAFHAVSADSVAADSVGQLEIKNNAVATENIINNTITGTDIQNETITSADIQNGTITGTDIQNETITGTDIANRSIGSVDIGVNAVGGNELNLTYTDGRYPRKCYTAVNNPFGTGTYGPGGVGIFEFFMPCTVVPGAVVVITPNQDLPHGIDIQSAHVKANLGVRFKFVNTFSTTSSAIPANLQFRVMVLNP